MELYTKESLKEVIEKSKDEFYMPKVLFDHYKSLRLETKLAYVSILETMKNKAGYTTENTAYIKVDNPQIQVNLAILANKKVDQEKVNKYLKVVMVENYNVTYAEKLIPACDISEQISLASKEASGTGNMKFMLNGALTLGTEDGANVEIHELVGDDNIFIFGKDSETVIEHYENEDYESIDIYARNPKIKEAVDFIIGTELMSIGNAENLIRVFKEIIKKDWFMALLDLEDYIKTKEIAFKQYEDRENWAKKMLINISKAGYFSSDRTIQDYNDDIWKLN